MTASSEKLSYHHGNLRQALLDAALELVKLDGLEKLSLRTLAKHVGVSQSAPYRHFKDKTSLMKALASYGFSQLTGCLQEAVANSGTDILLSIQKGSQAYIEFAAQHPQIYRIMYSMKAAEFDDEEMYACHMQTYALLQQVVEAGFAQGVFTAQDTEKVALSVWSLVHGYAMLLIDGIIEKHQVSVSNEINDIVQVTNLGLID